MTQKLTNFQPQSGDKLSALKCETDTAISAVKTTVKEHANKLVDLEHSGSSTADTINKRSVKTVAEQLFDLEGTHQVAKPSNSVCNGGG